MAKPELALNNNKARERDPLTLSEKQLAANVLSSQMSMSDRGGRPLVLDATRSLGAKDSAHDVFFVRSDKKNAKGKRLSFAVKRFRRLANAQHEVNAFELSRQRGFDTLTPVGAAIYPVNPIGHLLVTENVPRFTTMNYLGWRNSYAGQGDYERRISAPLQQIGMFAAQMHSRGILHGDLQLKNIAQGQRGNFLLFDLEDASFSSPAEINDFDYVSRVGEDIKVLICSLVDRGFLWNSTDELFVKEVTNNLLDSYLANTAISRPELVDYASLAFDESIVRRARLHAGFAGRIGLPS